jgi:hypothetical protein
MKIIKIKNKKIMEFLDNREVVNEELLVRFFIIYEKANRI